MSSILQQIGAAVETKLADLRATIDALEERLSDMETHVTFLTTETGDILTTESGEYLTTEDHGQ